jgi:hypothetical protein
MAKTRRVPLTAKHRPPSGPKYPTPNKTKFQKLGTHPTR